MPDRTPSSRSGVPLLSRGAPHCCPASISTSVPRQQGSVQAPRACCHTTWKALAGTLEIAASLGGHRHLQNVRPSHESSVYRKGRVFLTLWHDFCFLPSPAKLEFLSRKHSAVGRARNPELPLSLPLGAVASCLTRIMGLHLPRGAPPDSALASSLTPHSRLQDVIRGSDRIYSTRRGAGGKEGIVYLWLPGWRLPARLCLAASVSLPPPAPNPTTVSASQTSTSG
eukprot:XP_017447809.1 PREDICTED: uncharacterized protein LOC108350547 [Rattus norvegicus]